MLFGFGLLRRSISSLSMSLLLPLFFFPFAPMISTGYWHFGMFLLFGSLAARLLSRSSIQVQAYRLTIQLQRFDEKGNKFRSLRWVNANAKHAATLY